MAHRGTVLGTAGETLGYGIPGDDGIAGLAEDALTGRAGRALVRLAAGVLAATVTMLAPAWSIGPTWLALLAAQRCLALEAWVRLRAVRVVGAPLAVNPALPPRERRAPAGGKGVVTLTRRDVVPLAVGAAPAQHRFTELGSPRWLESAVTATIAVDQRWSRSWSSVGIPSISEMTVSGIERAKSAMRSMRPFAIALPSNSSERLPTRARIRSTKRGVNARWTRPRSACGAARPDRSRACRPRIPREATHGPAARGVVPVFRQPGILQERRDVVVTADQPYHGRWAA